MKHVIEAGTDGATLCAFDPAALPADFDDRVAADTIGLLEALQSEGRLWFGGTGGDGSHIVHVIVGERPEALKSERPAFSGTIELPSGKLWVCGAEYMANDPLQGSAATPTGGLGHYDMGGCVEMAPGRYTLHAFEIDNDDDDVDAINKMTPVRWLQVLPMVLFGLGAIATLFAGAALLISLFIKLIQTLLGSPLAGKGWHALPVMLAFVGGGIAAMGAARFIGHRLERLPAVIRDDAAYKAARMAHPDVVLVLEPAGDAASRAG